METTILKSMNLLYTHTHTHTHNLKLVSFDIFSKNVKNVNYRANAKNV